MPCTGGTGRHLQRVSCVHPGGHPSGGTQHGELEQHPGYRSHQVVVLALSITHFLRAPEAWQAVLRYPHSRRTTALALLPQRRHLTAWVVGCQKIQILETARMIPIGKTKTAMGVRSTNNISLKRHLPGTMPAVLETVLLGTLVLSPAAHANQQRGTALTHVRMRRA